MEKNAYFPKTQDIEKASERLKEILTPTPLQLNAHFSNKYGCDVYLKREDLQMVRSYKIRGAYNKIRSIQPEVLKYGIVCASAGNHAQGVAFSCNKLKIMGSIYMPVTTPRQKIEAVSMFGKEYVDIVLTGDTFDEANEAAIKYAQRSGKTFIPRERADMRSHSSLTSSWTTSSSLSEEADWPRGWAHTCTRSGRSARLSGWSLPERRA